MTGAAVAFRKRLLILGFGCIGQGVLPLLLRHIAIRPKQVLVITPHVADRALAESYGVSFMTRQVTQENLLAVLLPHLDAGDFLLNLSVGVSSLALITLCRERGALYLDTCIEPWSGQLQKAVEPLERRTNYAQREAVLALRSAYQTGSTAVLTHGANPGLVSHLLKQALLNMAQDDDLPIESPKNRAAWAQLAAMLGMCAVQIAEHDTQSSAHRKQAGEFVNTWSVDAFVEEACQPSELGWGSAERYFPVDGCRHSFGNGAAIYLQRPGASTAVRSWTPLRGPMHGYLVTHAESISIADYFSEWQGGQLLYRPTVYYAYRPCDAAMLSLHELAERNWCSPSAAHILKDDIDEGSDALGVLVMCRNRRAYWYGSQLSIAQTRTLCPHNSATSLQVAATVLAGVVWAVRNPACGLVEPDELPFDEILSICKPYLGDVSGHYTDWTPLLDRDLAFAQDIDASDPWQFKNFRIS